VSEKSSPSPPLEDHVSRSGFPTWGIQRHAEAAIYKLTNSNLTTQLREKMLLAKRLAEATKLPADIERAYTDQAQSQAGL